jgi:hypothetical protein
MLIFQPPVNFCSDENIQTIFGTKLEDFSNYRIDYNSISQTVENVVKKIFFVCNRTRNEHFACLEQAAKLNFAAVALTTAVKVKVISILNLIFIYYHNYNISISVFAV